MDKDIRLLPHKQSGDHVAQQVLLSHTSRVKRVNNSGHIAACHIV
jgi:hypothetical protein